MARLLVIIFIAWVIQLLLLWTITHYGLLALGACAWMAWSWWKGRQRHA